MDFTVRGSDSGRGNRFICSSEVCTISVAYPTSYSVGNGGLVTGAKRTGRETDYLPLSRAEVKNEWSYTSTMPLYLHYMCRNITLLPFTLRKLVNNSMHKPLSGSRCWPSYCMRTAILSQPVHRTAACRVWWCQMLCDTVLTSWWWAQLCSKHVEVYNKLIIKQELVR